MGDIQETRWEMEDLPILLRARLSATLVVGPLLGGGRVGVGTTGWDG